MDADHILPEEEFHRHAMLVIFLFCHAEAAPMESHRRAQRGLPCRKDIAFNHHMHSKEYKTDLGRRNDMHSECS